jgi:putative transposase
MPRCARIKSPDSVYHIMVRSISDTLLYKSCKDKDKYLSLIKKYQGIFLFKVYAYCIMDTHAHIIIDTAGADISKIMQSINQCYAQYFNLKYNRRGHLFQDRFKSKIIYDDRYLITLSSYIHNNPADMEQYKNDLKSYKYSSLSIYLGLRKDEFNILDTDFILEQFSKDKIVARHHYSKFVQSSNSDEPSYDTEFKHERAEYRSECKVLIRNANPIDVINFVAKYTKHNRSEINIKHIKSCIEFKSISALLMRGVCDMKQKDICREMGNITQSHASRLCLNGLYLINKKSEYKNIIYAFIKAKAC